MVEGRELALVSRVVGVSSDQVHSLNVLLGDRLLGALGARKNGGGSRGRQAVLAVDCSGDLRDSALAVSEFGSSIGSVGSGEVTGALDGSSGSLEAVCGLVLREYLYEV